VIPFFLAGQKLVDRFTEALDGDRRKICHRLSGPLTEVKAAGLSPQQQLDGLERSVVWTDEFLTALHAAAKIALGAEGSEATVGHLLWGPDAEFFKLHNRPVPLMRYWPAVFGFPADRKADPQVVRELEDASRLTRGLIDAHWQSIVSAATP
jgi:hypothetical protein